MSATRWPTIRSLSSLLVTFKPGTLLRACSQSAGSVWRLRPAWPGGVGPEAARYGHRLPVQARGWTLGRDGDSGASSRVLRSCRLVDVRMAIHRLPGSPTVITSLQGRQAVYQVALSAVPSRAWRAAFGRPPARLGHSPFTPDGIELQGSAVIFRAAPSKVQDWLRWNDRWIAYANSVVDE